MGILDRILGRNVQPPQPPQPPQPKTTEKMISNSARFTGGESGRLIELIEGGVDIHSLEPKMRRDANIVLSDALPPLRAAYERVADFVGFPEVEASSSAVERALKEFLETVPVQFENNPDTTRFMGVEMFTKTTVQNSMKFGMTFVEDNFDPESKLYKGILLHDSSRFDYYASGKIYEILRYSHPLGGFYDVNEESRFWHSFGYNYYPDQLWGIQANHGAEFFSKMLIRMIRARTNAWMNSGYPMVMSIFGMKGDAVMEWGKEEWDRFFEKVNPINDQIMAGKAEKAKGKDVTVMGSLPGDFTLEVKAFGENITPMTGFNEDFKILMPTIATITGVPSEVLSLVSDGGGISGEKFKVAIRLLKPMIGTIRSQLRPMLKERADNWLEANKFAPSFRAKDAYKITFKDQDYISPEDHIQAMQTAANTYKVQFENIVSTAAQLDQIDLTDERIRKAAEENHMDWLYEQS